MGVPLVTLVTALVVLLVHAVSVLLGVVLSTELVGLVHALGLGQFVNLGADKASDGLLGECVLNGLA